MDAVRRLAHALLAAGDDDVAVAVADRLVAERDGAQPRAAQLVDAVGGLLVRGCRPPTAAWRAGFWPSPAVQDLAQDDLRHLLRRRPRRGAAPRRWRPRRAGGPAGCASPPLKAPTGVRAALAMTMSVMGRFSSRSSAKLLARYAVANMGSGQAAGQAPRPRPVSRAASRRSAANRSARAGADHHADMAGRRPQHGGAAGCAAASGSAERRRHDAVAARGARRGSAGRAVFGPHRLGRRPASRRAPDRCRGTSRPAHSRATGRASGTPSLIQSSSATNSRARSESGSSPAKRRNLRLDQKRVERREEAWISVDRQLARALRSSGSSRPRRAPRAAAACVRPLGVEIPRRRQQRQRRRCRAGRRSASARASSPPMQ